MLILRSGITGFQPAPSVNEKEFKQVCYSIAYSRKLEFIRNEPGKNYYECIMDINNKRIHVLLNSQYPLITFTTKRDINDGLFPFIYHPKLARGFEQYYHILGPEELNESISFSQKAKMIIVKNDNTLHEGELEQLFFWRPKTIGDIVFNHWD